MRTKTTQCKFCRAQIILEYEPTGDDGLDALIAGFTEMMGCEKCRPQKDPTLTPKQKILPLHPEPRLPHPND